MEYASFVFVMLPSNQSFLLRDSIAKAEELFIGNIVNNKWFLKHWKAISQKNENK